uniref:Putative secreted protein n=1 Tax=Anopheles darlingi TaxID=43151 RepID=A0A2M4D7A8_ANODA
MFTLVCLPVSSRSLATILQLPLREQSTLMWRQRNDSYAMCDVKCAHMHLSVDIPNECQCSRRNVILDHQLQCAMLHVISSIPTTALEMTIFNGCRTASCLDQAMQI